MWKRNIFKRQVILWWNEKPVMHKQYKNAIRYSGRKMVDIEASGAAGGGSSKKKSAVQRRCVIMDEVDGMGAGDRSGMSELIQMIKKSKVPIVSSTVLRMHFFSLSRY